MFGGIFVWLIIGLVIYLMFSRRGGMMGCCGGHNHNPPKHTNHQNPLNGDLAESDESILEMKKEDYRVKTKT